MKIAQIAPLYEPISPRTYNGMERMISYLTEELVEQGHEVTLFASGDSVTAATLVTHSSESLRDNKNIQDPLAHHVAQMQDVLELADEFDLLHFHTDYFHFPFSSFLRKPKISTLHNRLDIPDLVYVYHKFKEQPLVSISNAQRQLMPVEANWVRTVYYGIPEHQYKKSQDPDDYVVYVGSISPKKRPDRAISVAKEAGVKIRIAAKMDQMDQTHYEVMIEQLMKQPHVEFVGEVSEEEKVALIANARALLYPIDWPVPFGMVLIQAMACGTPIIAYRQGAVSEIVDHGMSGFVVEHFDEAVRALEHVDMISRDEVRSCFEQRFTAEIMAENYVKIYDKIRQKTSRTYIMQVD